MQVEVIGGLTEETTIWRYMSIDKFINLLEDSGLFFSPLSFYKKSDPFEGYPPAFVIKLMYSIGDKFYENMQENIKHWENLSATQAENPEFTDALIRLKSNIKERPGKFRETFTQLSKGMLVNCWYGGVCESEAMWKLYGESNKGVAIRSTVGKLKAALETAESLSWPNKMFIGKVKYLDYADVSLTPRDCMIGGHIAPLLKRNQFSHENEIRAFFVPDISYENLDAFESKPYQMNMDISGLIEAVYISPYVDMSYAKAVRAVFKRYALQCQLNESDLLSGDQQLFDFLNI
ncbi:hypothetical protein ACFMKY_18095 [Pseudomonas protegens]|uniref:hypothetical protein n=1 Tax=Pseudomonas protegens TaxID=380021 RepID=UPI00366B829D